MAAEIDLHNNSDDIYGEFDVRVVDNEERYFCLLQPCVEKNKSLSNRQHWITHRKFVHKEKDNVNLPSGRVIRKWLTERAGGYQPVGRITATPAAAADLRMITTKTAPSSSIEEEGNNKTYNLVLQISGLMTQLGNAWQELARSVQDSSLTVPQALPQLVREKIKELYQSFDRGVSVSADISEMRKFEENNGRKQRRKRIEREGEGDTAEWGSMGKAMAGEVHFQKQLKMVHDRDGQPMYHTGHHETEHSMEEGVVEDGHEIHGMESRVVEVGWGLQGLGQGL
ncbi:unnamed protein product [Sphagnum jensenii]|jgi:hypothetical protein|uniref:C2H2-type domain-containing protein n=1 Tax=Sphagnum jensenii TaxID=128206 RepID=A0ABP1AVN8_9BRYO